MRLYLDKNEIVLDFPYDQQQVSELKQIRGARWDKQTKLWRVPVTSLAEAREFAIKHEFDVTIDVLTFSAPKPRTGTAKVYLDEDMIAIRVPYERVIVKAVKQIPAVSWNANKHYWQAPASSVLNVMEWAEKFEVPVEPEVSAMSSEVTARMNQFIEASRSTEAEIEIPALQGELLPYQRAGVAYASSAKRTFIADDMGLGKEQAVSSLVLTPNGWVRMGDIKVGMYVTGRNGQPTLVTGVYPQGIKPMYRVTFVDGASTLAGEEHLWAVRTATIAAQGGEWLVVNTGQIIRGETLHRKNANGRTYEMSLNIRDKAGHLRLRVPMVEPVHYSDEDKPLPIDPYLLGCWLGDGTTIHGQITSADEGIHDVFRESYECGAIAVKSKASTITYKGLMTDLRKTGVLGNKHIPIEFLRSSPESRLAVLQGLMDTDGSVIPDGHGTEFSTSNKHIADGVIEIVRSLGGVTRTRTRIPKFSYKGIKKEGKLSYRINVKLPSGLSPFRLSKHVDKYETPTKYPPVRIIESIEYSHDEEAQCIAVAAHDHLYVTDDFIVTHNTLQSIATVEYVWDSYPAVVVCPPSLVLNWVSEWNRWLPNKRVVPVTNRKDFPERGSYDVVIVGYSNIAHWEKRLAGHRAYIFDESHYAKTPTAQRTKAAVKMAKSAHKDGLVLCLTGTPVTNRPNEYASQLEILGRLKDFGGLWGFYRRYCAAYQDNFGQWNISGNSHLDELNERLRGTCYIRRTKDQVLSELPPVIHSRVLVEGSSTVMKEYVKAEKDILLYIAERARQLALEQGKPSYGAAIAAMIRAEANEHLVRLSVLRKIAAKAKMEVAEEWINARIENGKKVVVAAHHRDIVDELARKYGNLRIQGGMSVEEVEENKRRFQTESVESAPVMVLSIQAAKTGHTLTAAEECLFLELPWTPADVDQTYSRLHRLGQKGSVTATYMLTSGTIDEEIYEIIEAKRSVVNAAVEGGRVDNSDLSTKMIMSLLDKLF